MAVLWLLLVCLVTPTLVWAQDGGDEDLSSGLHPNNDPDAEPTMVGCLTQISLKTGTILICHLDKDAAEEVVNITLREKGKGKLHSAKLEGSHFTFKDLNVLSKYDLTIHFETREPFVKTCDLRKMVKPMAPWIVNATFSEKSDMASIYIGTQYDNDQEYLTNKLRFEVMVRNSSESLTHQVNQNILSIEGMYLKKNSKYHVKVRAEPSEYFRGEWSDWSPSVTFHIPKGPAVPGLIYTLTIVPLFLLMFTGVVVLRWYKEIRSTIWPNIPNPKNTLVQVYRQKKGLPVSFNPEAFSDINITVVDRLEEKHAVPEIPDGLGSCEVRGHTLRSSAACPEESLPMLQGGEGGGGEAQEEKTRPSTAALDSEDGEGQNHAVKNVIPQAGRRDEAYVTMSSLYQTH